MRLGEQSRSAYLKRETPRNLYFNEHPAEAVLAFMMETERRMGRKIFMKSDFEPMNRHTKLGGYGCWYSIHDSHLQKPLEEGWITAQEGKHIAHGNHYIVTDAGRKYYEETLRPILDGFNPNCFQGVGIA